VERLCDEYDAAVRGLALGTRSILQASGALRCAPGRSRQRIVVCGGLASNPLYLMHHTAVLCGWDIIAEGTDAMPVCRGAAVAAAAAAAATSVARGAHIGAKSGSGAESCPNGVTGAVGSLCLGMGGKAAGMPLSWPVPVPLPVTAPETVTVAAAAAAGGPVFGSRPVSQ